MSRLPRWAPWALGAAAVALLIFALVPELRAWLLGLLGLVFGTGVVQRRRDSRGAATQAVRRIDDRAQQERASADRREEASAARVESARSELPQTAPPLDAEERAERIRAGGEDPFAS